MNSFKALKGLQFNDIQGFVRNIIFVIGRVLHSVVQIFTDNIRLRGMVFTINFAAVLAMWALILIGEISL